MLQFRYAKGKPHVLASTEAVKLFQNVMSVHGRWVCGRSRTVDDLSHSIDIIVWIPHCGRCCGCRSKWKTKGPTCREWLQDPRMLEYNLFVFIVYFFCLFNCFLSQDHLYPRLTYPLLNNWGWSRVPNSPASVSEMLELQASVPWPICMVEENKPRATY